MNSNNNWLGFSLSPHHMNMEITPDPHHHHQAQSSAAASATAPTSFYLSPQLNNSGIYYGVEAENGGYYSHLPVMPLKSDGSLCIMEAISSSHQEGTSLAYLFVFINLFGFF